MATFYNEYLIGFTSNLVGLITEHRFSEAEEKQLHIFITQNYRI